MQTALDLEKHVRGLTAGYNTPTFVCDAPGGGGKRDVHSFEYYDRVTGISVFTAPSVKPGREFLYFDPIDALPNEGRARWANPVEHQKMIDHAITRSRAELSSSADVLGTPTVVSRRHRRHLPVLDAPRIQVDPQ